MRSPKARFLTVGITAVAMAAALAACSSGKPSTSTKKNTSPILIGASLSLTGDFSADGNAYDKGYKLWAHDVNAAGGILGRKVKLIILNDASSTTTVDTNYTELISKYHVNMLFGPFSSLLTTPSEAVAARNNFVMIEGAGGAPTVFAAPSNKADHNVFDVSLPIADTIVPFAKYLASLPASKRPKTAAYPQADDPFAIPPVATVVPILKKAGIKTVYDHIFPEEEPDYTPAADDVAAAKPDVVVLGSTDVPTVAAFMKAFEQQHFVPKYFIAAAGPDQGAAFISAVGSGNANGMMVPNGWYPGVPNKTSQKVVAEYVAKYGGTASDVNSDVAEAYSVGQVTEAAIKATGGTNQDKIKAYLHSASTTIPTVQGPVHFNSLGESLDLTAYVFQWQNGKFVQVLPKGAPGTVKLLAPKPAWTS
jgi:branched-chain amino acid transport system substrate-binding protein